jgi:hypothetical protein
MTYCASITQMYSIAVFHIIFYVHPVYNIPRCTASHIEYTFEQGVTSLLTGIEFHKVFRPNGSELNT